MSKGFTQIPNDIMTKMYGSGLNGSDAAVYAFIVRKLCGFHKTGDRISFSQIENATGLSRRSAIRSVSELEKRHLINVKRTGTSANYIELASVKSVTSTSVKSVTSTSVKSADSLVTNLSPTKYKKIKGGISTNAPLDGGHVDRNKWLEEYKRLNEEAEDEWDDV